MRLQLIVLLSYRISPAMRPKVARRPRAPHKIIDASPDGRLSRSLFFSLELCGSFIKHLVLRGHQPSTTRILVKPPGFNSRRNRKTGARTFLGVGCTNGRSALGLFDV
ncbi:hypothetical protein K469DRAFT_387590 [Zopfia rhizophila CBS 207.26]|uniref:Uncharacterized protein n=1 Tax=Zopfia rhizophila CBS 207.26 TaxID=1314779 RepID=A0A6A6EIL1_9PEZI|nr:hypothetical protein K469DRAFT_387590 [Zopfia rhizophila CBS 207.26]